MLLGESYRLKLIEPVLQDLLFLCAERFESCYPVVGHGPLSIAEILACVLDLANAWSTIGCDRCIRGRLSRLK